MQSEILQVGVSYTLPVNAKFVVKEMGVSTKYTMLLHGAFTIIDAVLKDASVTTYRLLLKIIDEVIPFSGNTVKVNIKETAKMLSIKDRAVYNSLKILIDGNILKRERRSIYCFNPYLIWSGRTAERAIGIIKWEELKA